MLQYLYYMVFHWVSCIFSQKAIIIIKFIKKPCSPFFYLKGYSNESLSSNLVRLVIVLSQEKHICGSDNLKYTL
jgi:hypothetical protein